MSYEVDVIAACAEYIIIAKKKEKLHAKEDFEFDQVFKVELDPTLVI